MPSKSKKQHNAMMAAAHGNSSLGISSMIGKEFVQADSMKGKPNAFGNPKKKKSGLDFYKGRKH